jgi:hypothetical protein
MPLAVVQVYGYSYDVVSTRQSLSSVLPHMREECSPHLAEVFRVVPLLQRPDKLGTR